MRWDDDECPAANLRARLPKRLRKYIDVGHTSFDETKNWNDLHAFRIQTKRIRYTLELFAEFYGPQYQELVDRIRRVQTLLGEINDLVSARRLLKKMEGHEDLRQRFRERAHRKLAKARAYWREEFDDAGAERWIRYLKTQARVRPAA